MHVCYGGCTKSMCRPSSPSCNQCIIWHTHTNIIHMHTCISSIYILACININQVVNNNARTSNIFCNFAFVSLDICRKWLGLLLPLVLYYKMRGRRKTKNKNRARFISKIFSTKRIENLAAQYKVFWNFEQNWIIKLLLKS